MLDDHILDCGVCRRVYGAIMDHEAKYLPVSLEDILRFDPKGILENIRRMPELPIVAPDYDHVMVYSPPAQPPIGRTRIVRASRS